MQSALMVLLALAASNPPPSMLGTWHGTLTIRVQLGDAVSTQRCPLTMRVEAVTGFGFSGRFQASGDCDVSGALGGRLEPSGAVLVTVNPALAPLPANCTEQDEPDYRGRLVQDSATLGAMETLDCRGVFVERVIRVTLTRETPRKS